MVDPDLRWNRDGGTSEATSRPASVLLVDDRPANLVALEATLAPLGIRTVTAVSGPEALRRLLADADLRRRLGEAGRRYVAAEYDWDVVERRTEEFLRSLAP